MPETTYLVRVQFATWADRHGMHSRVRRQHRRKAAPPIEGSSQHPTSPGCRRGATLLADRFASPSDRRVCELLNARPATLCGHEAPYGGGMAARKAPYGDGMAARSARRENDRRRLSCEYDE